MKETTGERLSKARRYANMNQKELAKKANITTASISRYENNIRQPNLAAIKKLSDTLNVSTAYLLCLEDEVNSNDTLTNNQSENDICLLLKGLDRKFKKSENLLFRGEVASQETIDAALLGIKMILATANSIEINK